MEVDNVGRLYGGMPFEIHSGIREGKERIANIRSVRVDIVFLDHRAAIKIHRGRLSRKMLRHLKNRGVRGRFVLYQHEAVFAHLS